MKKRHRLNGQRTEQREQKAELALIMPSRDGRKDAKRLNGQQTTEAGAERVVQWDAAHPVTGYGLR